MTIPAITRPTKRSGMLEFVYMTSKPARITPENAVTLIKIFQQIISKRLRDLLAPEAFQTN